MTKNPENFDGPKVGIYEQTHPKDDLRYFVSEKVAEDFVDHNISGILPVPEVLEVMSAVAKTLNDEYGLQEPVRDTVFVYAHPNEASIEDPENLTTGYLSGHKLDPESIGLLRKNFIPAIQLRKRYFGRRPLFEVVLPTEELTGVVTDDTRLVITGIAKAMLKIPVREATQTEDQDRKGLLKRAASLVLRKSGDNPDATPTTDQQQELLDRFVTSYRHAITLAKPRHVEQPMPKEVEKRPTVEAEEAQKAPEDKPE